MLQLTGTTLNVLSYNTDYIGRILLKSPCIQTIIPAMVDCFETPHYVFVRGRIPCTFINLFSCNSEYVYIDNWRNDDEKAWESARWFNGMAAAHGGVTESGKTIVCGHWHCSFGHSHYECKGGEFDNNPDFTPYYGDEIIALDACAVVSRKVNCIVIDD